MPYQESIEGHQRVSIFMPRFIRGVMQPKDGDKPVEMQSQKYASVAGKIPTQIQEDICQ